MRCGGTEIWDWSYTSGLSVKTGPEEIGPDFNKTGNFNIAPAFCKVQFVDQPYVHWNVNTVDKQFNKILI